MDPRLSSAQTNFPIVVVAGATAGSTRAIFAVGDRTAELALTVSDD